uniref:Expansin-like EG45 domain-containing protein n=1 Tax=Biomphalaria glabrata TaxID=6526 RepID=A0A2C9JYK0_BIOGL
MLCQFVCLLVFSGVVLGSSRCHNDSHGILKYSGLPCASVRLYTDNHKGACGCGPTDLDAPFAWNLADYVAAPNQKFFDDGGNNAFCGHNCGQCVKLTPTGGGYGAVLGPPPVVLTPHIFMITNVCTSSLSPEWCSQTGKPGTINQYFHFCSPLPRLAQSPWIRSSLQPPEPQRSGHSWSWLGQRRGHLGVSSLSTIVSNEVAPVSVLQRKWMTRSDVANLISASILSLNFM